MPSSFLPTEAVTTVSPETDASAGSPGVEPPSAVVATGLHLPGRRGLVYGPVDLTLPRGVLLVVQGPQGAGRSSLLLTLAGRMVPDKSSRLRVLGHELPGSRSKVQRLAAVAGFAGIDDLDESVRVSDVVRERLAWLSPWYRRVPAVTQRVFTTLAEPIWRDRPIPRIETLVWDLDEVDVMLLRIALAMAQHPDLLVVDDVDQVHDSVRRQVVWSSLEAIAAAGTTVIASVSSLGEAAAMSWTIAPHQLHLSTGPHALTAA